MSMNKTIFFDIDGTIWDDDMNIPISTVRAIIKLRENGHKAFLCTGRARASVISQKLFDIGFDGIIAACGCYVEMDDKVLFDYELKPNTVKKVIDVLRRAHMPVVLEGSRDYWIDEKGFEEDPYVEYLFDEMKEHARVLREYNDDIHICKFSADIIEKTDFSIVKNALEDEFEILHHAGNVVEFVPKGFSKAIGIKWLCNHLGIDIEDTYAIGDSVNDIDMLDTVGCGIAMGNAADFVKDAADYVTTDLTNDGVQNALAHFALI